MNSEAWKAASGRMVELWQALEKISGVTLTLHDHTGLINASQKNSLLPGINFHRAHCCCFPQKNRQKCLAHCSVEARKLAAEQKKPFTMCCWRGIKELVMPLYVKQNHALTLFAGTFRDEKFDLSTFPKAYRKLYEQLPLWDEGRKKELEALLIAAGSAALQLAENYRSRIEPETEREKKIREFFTYRAAENVGVADLAAELGLSESRTLHILKKLFGKGFSRLLNEERVKQAVEYLENSGLTLREIAALTGFRNEYYFSTVFRKIKNVSPGSFRRKR